VVLRRPRSACPKLPLPWAREGSTWLLPLGAAKTLRAPIPGFTTKLVGISLHNSGQQRPTDSRSMWRLRRYRGTRGRGVVV